MNAGCLSRERRLVNRVVAGGDDDTDAVYT
jgi:hypothetical protein